AKVSVLSNSTLIHRQQVHDALLRVDNNILKLDTVSPEYIQRVDHPQGIYDVNQVIERLKAFKGRVIIQSMFMQGNCNGEDVDNTGDEYVLPWLEAIKEIQPRQVMIYTIDRETPTQGLLKATHEQLDRIAALVRAEGIDCSVSY
ncbi:MAG: radical SAM protein, partial [Prevotella sp.]|nr:radical SAM protein [Prevotella sp.]